MKMLAAAAIAVLALGAQASAETRDVGQFSSVEAQGRFEVEITQGPLYSVEVVGADADRVATQVRGGELLILPTSRPWFGTEPEINAVIRIVTPRLDGVAASRGAEVTVSGMRANDLDLSAAMGGVVRAAGACARLDVSASMGGMVEAEGLTCATVDASASMGGNIRVAARDAVDASASMGGNIEVGGGPRRRDTSSTMGGAISFN